MRIDLLIAGFVTASAVTFSLLMGITLIIGAVFVGLTSEHASDALPILFFGGVFVTVSGMWSEFLWSLVEVLFA